MWAQVFSIEMHNFLWNATRKACQQLYLVCVWKKVEPTSVKHIFSDTEFTVITTSNQYLAVFYVILIRLCSRKFRKQRMISERNEKRHLEIRSHLTNWKKKCNSWRFIPTSFLVYLFSRPIRQEPVTFKWKFYYLACDQGKRKFNSRIWLFKIGNSMKKILEKLSRWRASNICMEKRKCQSESACVGQTKKMTSDINILFFQITGSSYELTHWRTSMMRSKMCLEQDATRILFDPFIWPFSLCRFLRMWLFSQFVWLAGFVWSVDEPINTSNNGSISFSTESICVWIVTDIFIRSTNKKP